MTKEQSKFLIEIESIDKRLADYAQERLGHGVTVDKIKADFRRCAATAGKQ